MRNTKYYLLYHLYLNYPSMENILLLLLSFITNTTRPSFKHTIYSICFMKLSLRRYYAVLFVIHYYTI